MCVVLDTVNVAAFIPVITTIGDTTTEKYVNLYTVNANWLECNQCNAGDTGVTGLCEAPSRAIGLISITNSAYSTKRKIFPDLSAAATSTWWQGLFTAAYGDRTGADYALLSRVQSYLAGTAFTSPMTNAKVLGAVFAGVGVKRLNQEGMQLEMLSKSSIDKTSSSYNVLSSYRVGCQGSIYQEAVLAKMIANPPVVLVADYKKCHASASASAQQTLGNALAMAGVLAGSVLSVAIGLFTTLYNTYTLDPKKRIKTAEDKAKEDEVMAQINADALPSAIKVIEALLAIEKNSELRATPEAQNFLQFIEEQKRKLDELDAKSSSVPNPLADLCPCPI